MEPAFVLSAEIARILAYNPEVHHDDRRGKWR
jgi:hypothetical protein